MRNCSASDSVPASPLSQMIFPLIGTGSGTELHTKENCHRTRTEIKWTQKECRNRNGSTKTPTPSSSAVCRCANRNSHTLRLFSTQRAQRIQRTPLPTVAQTDGNSSAPDGNKTELSTNVIYALEGKENGGERMEEKSRVRDAT